MRCAVGNKERWKGRRAPTQNPSTNHLAYAGSRAHLLLEWCEHSLADLFGDEDEALLLQARVGGAKGWGWQLCDALDHMHSTCGWVHKRLWPEHVLVRNGGIKLSGFAASAPRFGEEGPSMTPLNTKEYSSTYHAMGFANVRAGTQKHRGVSCRQAP